MAKSIYVVKRKKKDEDFSSKVIKLMENISPDNISARKPYIVEKELEHFGISNPPTDFKNEGMSFYLGDIVNENKSWSKLDYSIPEGTFALFRSNESHFQSITDVVGSRSIWYYFDEKILVASTSQRLIISYLERFKLNKDVIPWILSSGTLGPKNSWDTKINLMPNNTILSLDKKTWELNEKNIETDIKHKNNSKKQTLSKFNIVLKTSIQKNNYDYKKWVLPLSGGYDSRGILMYLRNKSKLKTITWGMEKSQKQPYNDANVAKKISSYYSTNHEYFPTNISEEEEVEVLLERFLKNGEGRIDHLSGYMDGFSIWKTFFDNGIDGIIRGDEGFGWRKVISEKDTKISVGMVLLTDYENLSEWHHLDIFKEQDIKNKLNKNTAETLYQYRDRIYRQYRIPLVLSALNDLKLPYVEISNPLLNKSIINYAMSMSDKFRTDKYIFKKIVAEFGPDIEFAKHNAIDSPANILKNIKIVNYIKKYIEQNIELASSLIDEEFVLYVMNNMNIKDENKKDESKENGNKELILNKIKMFFPQKIKSFIKQYIYGNHIDYNVLGFRIYIILKMIEIFEKDSNLIKSYIIDTKTK